ncbi:MAG: hypothetical protein JXC85_00970 [Candidatus Aenigmarchaeota archaeon]|nr:hypothetical protein [Candidatus Aenigmarchaeota archaeon]
MAGLVEKAKELMRQQTEKNRSPAWLLTEMAVEKGRQLARKHGADERLVVASLYLAHTIFDQKFMGEVQKKHTKLSAEFVRKHLDEWNVAEDDKKSILNSIRAHHNHVPTESLEAEVMKNAECFKFVTLKGSIIFLHECGMRGDDFETAVEHVLKKMGQKRKLLTLPDCIDEADENIKVIKEFFSKLTNDG